MITIHIKDADGFDNETEKFTIIKGGTFTFEHSLRSISKWESKYHKPFLSKSNTMTPSEQGYYFKCMCLERSFDSALLSPKLMKILTEYIADPYTATTFSDQNSTSNTVVTSEILYGSMASLNIPFECDKWNLNRLMVLIRVVADQQTPKKKMTRTEIIEQNRKLNEERKKKFNSKG